MHFKLMMGLLPCTHKYGILGNLNKIINLLLVCILIYLIVLNVIYLNSNIQLEDEKNKLIATYEEKNKNINKNINNDKKTFVLLQDPIITAPICELLAKNKK